MKFCERYREHMQGREKELQVLDLDQLKRILKACRNREPHSTSEPCPDCEGTFFTLLLKEMTKVVGCFNERAQKLLALHLASRLRRYLLWTKGKTHYSHDSIVRHVCELIDYAIISSTVIRKMLKKYDKVHRSKKGQAFQSQVQRMHIEVLQSPWLCELMAFYLNSLKQNQTYEAIPSLFESCLVTFDDGKPTLSCELIDSMKLDIDLTCSICLDTVFDIVSLSCGHIFCYTCACSAASVSIVDGLKTADPRSKCPLCRQAGVYSGYVRLNELNYLLSQNCGEYWKQRLQQERIERIQKTKEHWQLQCQAFMGF